MYCNMEEPMELSYFDLLFTDTVVLVLIWVFSEEIDILDIFNSTNTLVFLH